MVLERRVLVAGARGVLGAATADALAAAGWQVQRGTLRPPVDGYIDLTTPAALRSALAAADLAVTTVPHPDLPLERAALACGATVLSTALLPPTAVRKLASADTAGGTVVVHGGRVPGLTSLIAADLLGSHPAADAVTVAATFSSAGSSGPTGGASVHRMLTARGHHRSAMVELPAPFGRMRLLEIADDERAWLGALADGRSARFLVTFGDRRVDRFLRAVSALRLCKSLPRSMFVRPAAPALTSEPSVVRVSVEHRGTELAASTIIVEGGYRATAVATVAQADALLRHALPPGVHALHDVLTLGDVAARPTP